MNKQPITFALVTTLALSVAPGIPRAEEADPPHVHYELDLGLGDAVLLDPHAPSISGDELPLAKPPSQSLNLAIPIEPRWMPPPFLTCESRAGHCSELAQNAGRRPWKPIAQIYRKTVPRS